MAGVISVSTPTNKLKSEGNFQQHAVISRVFLKMGGLSLCVCVCVCVCVYERLSDGPAKWQTPK